MNKIIEKLSRKEYGLEEIAYLLEGNADEELFNLSSKIRTLTVGEKVYLRGIIDVSNYCSCDCKFCGNACSSQITRYRLLPEQIIDSIKVAQQDGIDLIHLASGLDSKINYEYLKPVIDYCKKNDIDMELAIGKKDISVYQEFINNGVNRFILKFETSNKEVFDDVKDCDCVLNDYLDFIIELKNRGAMVGSGNIIGLPNLSTYDICNDINLLCTLNLDMISTSVFVPNKESIYANAKRGDGAIALRFIAIINILMSNKRISIPTNSSYGTDNKIYAIKLGANVLSVNYTNEKFEKNYSIYDGSSRYRANLSNNKNYINLAGMECVTWKEFKKDV